MEKGEMELKKISLLDNFRREMNGAVAGTMREMRALDGLQSYGVSLPTIKLICSSHENSHDFALYIFGSKVRELKIAATILDEPQQTTREQIVDWVESCDNREVLNSVAKLAATSGVAKELFYEWITSDNEKYVRIALLIFGGAIRYGVEIEGGFQKIINVAQTCSRGEINEVVFALNALIASDLIDSSEILSELSSSDNEFAREVALFF